MVKTPHLSLSTTRRRAPVYRLPGTNGEVSTEAPDEEIRARATRTVWRLVQNEEERTGLLAMLGLDPADRSTMAGRPPEKR
ncbi:hypothetical protein [Amycolatopsis sp. lyj-90]|uniref:hypothetical protein n=1 Tax=Amycolatopsis sp. lyj-90 TaxID=2789285 RepID=UPI00397A0AA4